MTRYEWKPGEGTELISTGTAALGASLLGVSADGTDAFFFTREQRLRGRERQSGKDLRRQGRGWVPASASDSLQGLRRVSRRGQPHSAACGHRQHRRHSDRQRNPPAEEEMQEAQEVPLGTEAQEARQEKARAGGHK